VGPDCRPVQQQISPAGSGPAFYDLHPWLDIYNIAHATPAYHPAPDVLHILMGVSTAGVTLASANIGLKLAPHGGATAYLATINITNSLAAGIAPVIGGMFVDTFKATELSLTLNWKSPGAVFAIQTLDFQYWDFFFVFAFLIGIYSIHRLAYIKEAGEVEDRIVVRELIAQVSREMRNLSTAGGLRYMLRFPVLKSSRTAKAEKDAGDNERPVEK